VQNIAALVPVGCEARSFAGQAFDEFFDYTRSVSLNTDPLPGSLATVTSSPIIRASFRQIARPSPVPPSPESELALRFRQGLRLDQQTLSFVAAPALAEAHTTTARLALFALTRRVGNASPADRNSRSSRPTHRKHAGPGFSIMRRSPVPLTVLRRRVREPAFHRDCFGFAGRGREDDGIDPRD